MQADTSGLIQVAVIGPLMTRWGLEQLVRSAGSMSLATVAESMGDNVDLSGVDVVVIDHDAQREQGLLETALAWTSARCILLTSLDAQPMLDQAVVAGVRGIVRKTDSPQLLLKAIEKVHAGELWLDRTTTGRLFVEIMRRKAAASDDPEAARISTLTQREREMIRAIAADTSSPGKVIAGRLCISEHTLRNHLSAIYSKLAVSNRLDLYAFAARHRLDKSA